MGVNLKANPYYLDDEQIKWVNETFATLSLDEKIGQLLCPSALMLNKSTIKKMTQKYYAGSLMIRPMNIKGLQDSIRKLQENSKVPMLISANLENGGKGAINQGTFFSSPMGCAATNSTENGYRLGKISCREGASVGVNWSFAPIVDIDLNYHNPITNTRTFGNDKNMVLNMARQYMKAAKEEDVAVSIKHFPGDGVDERDQHLLVSVNELSYEDWLDSYGYIYQNLINEGAQTVMVGHISQPAVAQAIRPDLLKEDAFLPASQSRTIMTDLLRKKLNFNGVIVTDSTLMVGYMQSLPRKLSVPYSIECGADIILFNRSIEEDIRYIREGLTMGILTKERFEEAVIRVLALKASLNLHIKKERGTIVSNKEPMNILHNDEAVRWTRELADHAITLVKDTKHILPISPLKTKRVYLNVIEPVVINNSKFSKDIKKRLEKEGFEVTLRKRDMSFSLSDMKKGIFKPSFWKMIKEIYSDTESFVSKYDLCVIVLNMEAASNNTVVRVDWKVFFGLGNDIPWYAGEIPLLAISTANPYHLLDLTMAHTYINTYSANPETLDALFDKIMGRSEFKGISPIDPFCNHEDCKL